MDICSSPQLFAAYHVFLRLLVPRHPPCALINLTITLLHSVATVGRSELFSVCNLRYLCLLLNDFSFFLRIFRCASDVLKLACSFLYKHLFLDISVCSFQCTIFYSCWLFLISHYMLKFLLTSNHWSNQHLCKTFSWMISFLIRQPPALPCRLQHSTMGRLGLNHRVRDVDGCFPQAHRHRKFFLFLLGTFIIEQHHSLLLLP